MERVFDSSSYIASVHLFTWVCLGAMVLLVYPIYNHTNTLRRLETELRAQILDLKPLEKDASPPASVPAPAPPVMHVRDQLLHALQGKQVTLVSKELHCNFKTRICSTAPDSYTSVRRSRRVPSFGLFAVAQFAAITQTLRAGNGSQRTNRTETLRSRIRDELHGPLEE